MLFMITLKSFNKGNNPNETEKDLLKDLTNLQIAPNKKNFHT